MILVVGCGGQLGTALRARLGEGAAHYVDRPEVDLARPGAAAALRDVPFRALINCAAYTAVDAAEDDEATARRVNADAVGELAALAAERDAGFVTFSTDYVFPGDGDRPYVESDPTGPINAYGRSKLAGERAAAACHPAPLVIRTSWLVSATHPNFLTAILGRAREGTLQVVDDQHGCPTLADDLAAATLAAVRSGITGTLHLTNRGATTWYELAREAVRLAGLDAGRVTPCDSARFPRPAKRPAWSVLGTERADEGGVPTLPPWRDGLGDVVRGLLARGPG